VSWAGFLCLVEWVKGGGIPRSVMIIAECMLPTLVGFERGCLGVDCEVFVSLGREEMHSWRIAQMHFPAPRTQGANVEVEAAIRMKNDHVLSHHHSCPVPHHVSSRTTHLHFTPCYDRPRLSQPASLSPSTSATHQHHQQRHRSEHSSPRLLLRPTPPCPGGTTPRGGHHYSHKATKKSA